MTDFPSGPGTVEWLGTLYKTVLAPTETGGGISITDSLSPPASGPPRHVHHDADEAFMVLTGECEFWVAGERFRRGPGEAAFIPRGTEHTFRITSDTPSRHLVILTPGGFEGFFAEMATGQYGIPQDMEPITRIAEAHHMTFTGPPLEDEA